MVGKFRSSSLSKHKPQEKESKSPYINFSALWVSFNALLIAALYVPNISGSALSGRWAVASLSLYWIRFWPLLFSLYCFQMLFFAHAMHWAILAGAFSWGTASDSRVRRFVIYAFSIGVFVSFVVAIPQYLFGWNGVFQHEAPAGLFINRNMFGEAACLALVTLIGCEREYRVESIIYWILIPTLCLSILMTGSRAVWLALFVSSLLFLPLLLRLVGLAFGLLLAWLVFDHQSFDIRLMLWKTFKPSFFGHGEWWFNTLKYDADGHMHNEWLQLAHETGFLVLAPLCCVVYIFANHVSARPFILVMAAISSFSFPFQMPASGWFIAFILGTYLFNPSAKRRISLREGF